MTSSKKVLKLLRNFEPKKILINDINHMDFEDDEIDIRFSSKDEIYRSSDVISVHLPLIEETKNMISYKELKTMKKDAILLNTSRGGIINEKDLYQVLQEENLGGVALDVFENEPYDGDLKNIERCFLTAHIGLMTQDCRTSMEIKAIEEVIRFVEGKELLSEVPDHEVETQMNAKR